MKRFLAAALLVAFGAAPVMAQDALDSALARMAKAQGDDYVTARQAVVALGTDARVALERKLADAKWSDESFANLAAAEIASAYLSHPDVVAQVQKLEGVDSRHYTKRVRPDPECGRELKRLGKPAVGALLELQLKTFDRYAFTSATTRPDLPAREIERLATLEREALHEGIVVALAESRHPAAFCVLRDVARDAKSTDGTRMQALEGLGTLATDAAFAEITKVEGDATSPSWLRQAALRGAARVPSRDALSLIASRLGSGVVEERHQAVVALGTIGSAWGWEARGADQRSKGDAIRAEASAKLVDAIAQGGLGVDDESFVSAIGAIAHPSAKAQLEKLAADGTRTDAVRALAKKALARLQIALARNGG